MATIDDLITLAERENVDPVALLNASAGLPLRENVPVVSQAPPEPGSILADAFPQQVTQQPPQPPPPPEHESDLNVFRYAQRGFLTDAFPDPPEPTPEEEGWLFTIPRGISRGVAQTALSMAEGLMSMADIALESAGFEDAIDQQEGEAWQNLRDAQEWVGHEEGWVGKLSQALGSMILFAIPGLGQAGAAGRAAALAGKGAEFASAAKRVKGISKAYGALKWVAAGSAGAGEASQMREAYEKAGEDYTNGQMELSKRIKSLAMGTVIGFTELLPIELVLRGLPKGFGTGPFLQRMAGHIASGGLEGVQEAAAGWLQEGAAKINYDPDRPLGESALSDFGYGAGAGTIFSILFRNRGRMPDKEKTTKQLQKEVEDQPLPDPVTPSGVGTLTIYDEDGNPQEAVLESTADNFAQMSVEKDGKRQSVLVPMGDARIRVGPEGYSLYSDEDLITPHYVVSTSPDDGSAIEVSALSDEDLIDAQYTLEKRINEENHTLQPDEKYLLRAFKKEKKRRNLREEKENNEPDSQAPVNVDPKQKSIGDVLRDAGVRDESQQPEPRPQEAPIPVNEDPIGDTGSVTYTTTYKPRGTMLALDNDSDLAYRSGRRGGRKPDAATQNEAAANLDLTPVEYKNLSVSYAASVQEDARADAAVQEETSDPLNWEPFQMPSFREFVNQNKVGIDSKSVNAKQKELKISNKRLKGLIKDVTGNRESLLRDMTGSQRSDLVALMEQESAKSTTEKHNIEVIPRSNEPGVFDFRITNMAGETVEQIEVHRKARNSPITVGEINQSIEGIERKYNVPQDLLDQAYKDAVKIPAVRERQEPTDKLPRDLEGAKPRYGYRGDTFDLEFASDVQKALYIVADEKRASARDKDYLDFLNNYYTKNGETLTTREIRQRGKIIRDSIKNEAKDRSAYKEEFGEDAWLEENKNVINVPSQGAPQTQLPERMATVAPIEADQTQRIADVPGSGRAIRGPVAPSGMDPQVVNDVREIIERVAPNAQQYVSNVVIDASTGRPELGLQAQNVVAVSLEDGHLDPNNRAYHEATHYLWGRDSRFFTPEQEQTIRDNTDRMRNIVRKHLQNIERETNTEPGLYERAIPEDPEGEIGELLAYTSGLYNQQMDQTGKPPKEFSKPLNRVLEPVYQLFKRIKELFTGPTARTNQRIEDVLDQIRKGQVGRQAPRVVIDPTGFNPGNIPLRMVRNGSPLARQSDKPYVFSGIKEYLKTAKDSAKASEWINSITNPNKSRFKVKGKEWSVRKAELESSRLLDYLNVFEPNEQVSRKEIEAYVNDNEVLVQTIIYGNPIDSRHSNNVQAELQRLHDRLKASHALVGRIVLQDRPSAASSAIQNILISKGQTEEANNRRLSKDSPTYNDVIEYVLDPKYDITTEEVGSTYMSMDESGSIDEGFDTRRDYPGLTKVMDHVKQTHEEINSYSSKESQEDLLAARSQSIEPEIYPTYTTYGNRGEYANNYREVILSVPSIPAVDPVAVDPTKPDIPPSPKDPTYKEDALLWYHDHFPGVENPLVFMRLSDVVTEDGKQVLLVEEIQSDIHQEARNSMMQIAAREMYDKSFGDLTRAEKNAVRRSPTLPALEDRVYGVTIPNLPFKKTSEWTNLAVGHIVRMAGNGGYDGIAIANSELQVERYRYNFKNHISGIQVSEQLDFYDLVDNDIIDEMDVATPENPGTLAAGQNVEQPSLVMNINVDAWNTYNTNENHASEKPQIDNEIVIPIDELWERLRLTRYSDKIQGYTLETPSGVSEQLSFLTRLPLHFGKMRSPFYSYETHYKKLMQGDYQNIDAHEALNHVIGEWLLENRPELANKYIVQYERPMVDGPQADPNVYFFGKQQPIQLEFTGDETIDDSSYIQSELVFEDWIGKDIALLVQDDIDTNRMNRQGSQFSTDDIVGYIENKVHGLERTAKELESGRSTDPNDYRRVNRLLTDGVRQAVRPDGSVDIPVNLSHKQYDNQIPNFFKERLTDYLSGSKKREYKDDKQMLWLGNRDSITGEIEDIRVISEEDVGGMTPTTIPELTNEQRTLLMRGESLVHDYDVLDLQEREAAGLELEGEDIPQLDPFGEAQTSDIPEIVVSNVRNAVRYFPITEDMAGLEGNYSINDPVPAWRMAAAQASGTDERNTYTGKTMNRIARFVDGSLFQPLKGLPLRGKYLIARGKALGIIQQSEKVVKDIYTDLAPYLDKNNPKKRKDADPLRKAIYKYMTTGPKDGEEKAFEILKEMDGKVANAAQRSKNIIEDIGKMLVEKNLLPKEKFYERRRSYLPTIYLKHVLDNPAGQKYGYLLDRKEMTDEARNALGEIAELAPEFIISRAIQRPARDLAMVEFFNAVAQEKNWSIPNDAVRVNWDNGDGSTQSVSALWLWDHAKTMDDIAGYVRAGDPQRAENLIATAARARQVASPAIINYAEQNNLQSVLTDPTKPYAPGLNDVDSTKVESINTDGVQVLDERGSATFKRVPNSREYGMLAGMAVHKSIFDDVITGVSYVGWGDNAAIKGSKLGRKLTAIWKTIKVPMNPPTIARNTFSNMILMHLGGMPMRNILPNMYKAIQEIRAHKRGDMENSRHYQEMLERGVSEASFTESELFRWGDDVLHFLGGVSMKEAGILNWFKFRTWDKLAQNASSFYQTVEVVGKTAMAIDVMDRRGQSADDAYLIANETLFDYSLVPPLIRQARTSPVGVPFATFYYKVAPLLIKTALTNPLRFAPYIAMGMVLPEMFKQAFDIEDDEYDAIKAQLPDFVRTPGNALPVPIRDANGRVQFLNMGYILPWGAFLELANDGVKLGKTAMGVPQVDKASMTSVFQTLGLFGGPGIAAASFMLGNRDTFTGRKVIDTAEPWYVANAEESMLKGRGKILNTMTWAANQFILPGFLHTDYGATTRMFDAVNSKRNARGYEGDTLTQAALRFAGFNLYNIDPNKAREIVYYAEQDLANVVSARSKMLRNNSLSKEERRRRKASYDANILRQREVLKLLRETINITPRIYRSTKVRPESKDTKKFSGGGITGGTLSQKRRRAKPEDKTYENLMKEVEAGKITPEEAANHPAVLRAEKERIQKYPGIPFDTGKGVAYIYPEKDYGGGFRTTIQHPYSHEYERYTESSDPELSGTSTFLKTAIRTKPMATNTPEEAQAMSDYHNRKRVADLYGEQQFNRGVRSSEDYGYDALKFEGAHPGLEVSALMQQAVNTSPDFNRAKALEQIKRMEELIRYNESRTGNGRPKPKN